MSKETDEDMYKLSLGKRELTDFDRRVYAACRRIPKGKVTSYAVIAAAINAPKAFRAVGTSLKRNPFAPEVPCHRVVSSNLTLGGFRGSKGECTLQCKVDMLKEEGVLFDEPTGKKQKLCGELKVDRKCFIGKL